MNLTHKTVQGIGWSGTSQCIRLLLQLMITAILARLLTPNDFGLIAMVFVFTNLVAVFRDFGLTAAIIQRKGLVEEHLSSSFWVNVSGGIILTLLLAAIAPALADFYDEGRLTLIIMALASTIFISSFGIVQTALFTKELNFKTLTIIETSTVLISGTVAIVLAQSGFGIWSLVWQQIIFSFVMVLLLWVFSSWRPKFLFRWLKVKELLGFGLNLTGFSFVNYFNRNLDNFLIGKFLGSTPLGFYTLAYRLLLFPLNNISNVLAKVMFPSLSAIQDDKSKVRFAYISATRYIAAVTFPLMIGLLVIAPQFIRVIFGSQWERSVFLVQILALVGLVQSIISTVGWIYQSQGRTDIMFRWGIFSVVICTIAFVLGLNWDVEGVTIAYAIAGYLLLYPAFAIPFRLIDLKFTHYIKQFKTIFFIAVGMGAVTFTVRVFLENGVQANDTTTLIICVLVGTISYIGFLFLFERTLYHEFAQLCKQLKSPASVGLVKEKA